MMKKKKAGKSGYAKILGAGLAGLCGVLSLGLVGCSPSTGGDAEAGATSPSGKERVAIAQLSSASGSDAAGMVTFIEEEGGIRIIADVQGIAPGKHGFHIHEKGDCSAADASSAGGHFNPTNKDHAGPNAEHRHVGDLGNLVADDGRRASLERVDTHLTFDGLSSIIGKSVIVHAGEDDLESQPSGAAGKRVACGVIRFDS